MLPELRETGVKVLSTARYGPKSNKKSFFGPERQYREQGTCLEPWQPGFDASHMPPSSPQPCQEQSLSTGPGVIPKHHWLSSKNKTRKVSFVAPAPSKENVSAKRHLLAELSYELKDGVVVGHRPSMCEAAPFTLYPSNTIQDPWYQNKVCHPQGLLGIWLTKSSTYLIRARPWT